jgi:hypothetical protein
MPITRRCRRLSGGSCSGFFQIQASATLADLSNDGRYLSYIVVAGGNSTLYVADLTTGATTQIDSVVVTTTQAGGFSSEAGIDGGRCRRMDTPFSTARERPMRISRSAIALCDQELCGHLLK